MFYDRFTAEQMVGYDRRAHVRIRLLFRALEFTHVGQMCTPRSGRSFSQPAGAELVYDGKSPPAHSQVHTAHDTHLQHKNCREEGLNEATFDLAPTRVQPVHIS